MSNWPFRFIHAADFHLDEPLSGIVEIPEPLREAFLEAPWWAAQRVFETALSEQADFVVLSGGLLHPLKTGPRGPLFLVEHFERLAERGIAVYWAGGREDSPDLWPPEIKLPAKVRVFPAGRAEGVQHLRDGVPLVHLVGASRQRGQKLRTGDFASDPGGLFSVAAVHGNVNAESLRSRTIDYWALGGSRARSTLFHTPHAAHYPGSPQGRSPAEAGPHGCTLVQVDEQRKVRTTFLPCDVLRWQSERIAIDPATTRAELETRLHDRMNALRESQPGTDLLVSWSIAGLGPVLDDLRRGKLAAELLAALRSEYGGASPSAWSVDLDAEPPSVLPPEWYEQDTIRGDFLRGLRQCQAGDDAPLGLEAYLPEEHREGELAKIAALDDPAARDRVLREAAILGVDLLSGEGP